MPTSILLSQFTGNYRDLMIGVNISGVGALIASLTSLITYREFVNGNSGKTKYYIFQFSAYHFAFLLPLVLFESLLKIACFFVPQYPIFGHSKNLPPFSRWQVSFSPCIYLFVSRR